MNSVDQPLGAGLQAALAGITAGCTSCGACVVSCQFLKTYGTPQRIAAAYSAANGQDLVMPFECSLCGLCTAVCPEQIDPADMFLQMRRESVVREAGSFPEHKGLIGYERTGTSQRYSWYGLPAGCDTVFFPGCALPGTRPGQTKAVFERLQQEVPQLGIVLDCCTKPSHDCGCQEYFLAMFGELKSYLVAQGVKRVLVACPNCYKVFRTYAPELETTTIYELLADNPQVGADSVTGAVTVHDPCVMRFAAPVQDAVRSLIGQAGLDVEEMPHSRSRAICCGEGGAVAGLVPGFAAAWGDMRVAEAADRRVVTYCAGCANYLGSRTATSHVVDLLFDPAAALSGKAAVSRAPFTYLNRIRLKRHFRRTLPVEASRERTFTAGVKSASSFKPLIILVMLIAAIVAVRASGLSQYLEQERLRGFVAGYGALAPVIYMLVYTLAPALFLPGLPITIVGGILFGPVWGVVYTITSATAGACVAFLVSRYVARDWVEAKLTGSRWRKLDADVEKHGWKVVAFTRLIPLFPFNLLNYAFGLTKISFVEYALTTFFCMLPACIAFIVFSSSLLGLLKGKVSGTFLLGILLIVLVSLIPLFYRRLQQRRERLQARSADAAPVTWDLGRSLRRKGLFLALCAAVALAGVALANHFFWAINASLYTLEFNLLFMLHHLQTADLGMFTDYLHPMSAGRGFGVVLTSTLIKEFALPLTPHVLVHSAVNAFGMLPGIMYAAFGMLVAGCAGLACGRFFLGDVLPYLRERKGAAVESAVSVPMTLLPLLIALPWIPAVWVALVAGALRIPLQRAAVALAVGALLRVAWMVWL